MPVSDQQTTLSQLESHLWESAKILHGPVDAYVLPPLQEDNPPLPEASAVFKESLARCREAEERLACVMDEGNWLR